MNLARRPAAGFNVPFLLQLRRQSMDQHLIASGASTSEDDYLARLMYRFDCVYVLRQEGHPVGLLKVSRIASVSLFASLDDSKAALLGILRASRPG